MNRIANLLGKQKRSPLLLAGHFITGPVGIIAFVLLMLYTSLGFIVLNGKPAQTYIAGLFYMQFITAFASLVILVEHLAKNSTYLSSIVLGSIGSLACLATLFERVIVFAFYTFFSIDCAFRQEELNATDLRVCQSGDADLGKWFPLILWLLNIVFTIHLIFAILTFIGDLIWTFWAGKSAFKRRVATLD